MKKTSIVASILAITMSCGVVQAQDTPVTGGLFVEDEIYNQFDARPRTRSEILVRNVDLSSMFPIPGSQGPQGSCTGWAVSYGTRSYYNAKELGRRPLLQSEIYSPTFQYNMTAVKPDLPPVCGGAFIHKVLESMRDIGALTLDKVPYNQTICAPDFSQDPIYFATAAQSRIGNYKAIPRHSLKTITPFKEALQEGHPVVVNVKVPKAWNQRKTNEIHKSSGPVDLIAGSYHAMVVVGYNEDLNAVKIMNSWGTEWGDNGFIWVDYDVFSQIVVEGYTVSGLTPPIVPLDEFKSEIDLQKDDESELDLLLVSQSVLENYRSITVTSHVFDSAGNLDLEGFGCTDAIGRARAELASVTDKISLSLREDPWPACEVSGLITNDTLSDDLAISITNQNPAERGIKIGSSDIETNEDPTAYLTDGDRISLEVTGSVSKPHMQVYWLQADNSVKEIFDGIVKNQKDGQLSFAIGGEGTKALTVQAPYGNEAVLVIASSDEVIDYTFNEDTADYAFLDYLRYPSRAIKSKIKNADVAIHQIQVSSATRGSKNWLITPEELKMIGSGEEQDISTRELSDIGDPLGPKITVESPDVNNPIKGDNIVIAAKFEPKDGASVLPETLKVKYKKFGGWFNVTDRVRNGATQLDATGVKSAPLELPSGKHRLKVSIEDSNGREAMVDIRARVE